MAYSNELFDYCGKRMVYLKKKFARLITIIIVIKNIYKIQRHFSIHSF